MIVKDGMLETPEGIQYRLLWLPNAQRLLPTTLEKLYALIEEGATVIGEAPTNIATLSGGKTAEQQFDKLVNMIWGDGKINIRRIGKGAILSGMSLQKALTVLKITPDVMGSDVLWSHRQTDGADWYFISAPQGKGFNGVLSFRTNGYTEFWDPITGNSKPLESKQIAGRTTIDLSLAKSNSCFVVFRHSKNSMQRASSPKLIHSIPVSGAWTVSFPAGWGAPAHLNLKKLQPWKDMDMSPEGKAFSGTATYRTTFNVKNKAPMSRYVLDLGDVDMVASVIVNGKLIGNVLAPPYCIDLKDVVRLGQNLLEIKVTSTWFNRLVYDASQPKENRKTWVISGPDSSSALRASGLLGPVKIKISSLR
jgi:hypothetical protein